MGRPPRSVSRPGSASRVGAAVGSLAHGSAAAVGTRLLILWTIYGVFSRPTRKLRMAHAGMGRLNRYPWIS